jgi:O-antigen ligase
MIAILLILGAALPLVIAPNLLFHYDVSPKTILLMAATCLALTRARALPEELSALWNRRNGRAFILLAGAQALWMAVATIGSTRPWFSLFGSGWRQFGLITTLSLLVVGVLVAGHFCLHPERIRLFLRATAVAAIAASLYGIAQYFDFDPLQPAAMYHAHAGDSVIVRPPGTFGHGDYFGWWLAVALFCGVALARTNRSVWRVLGTCCAALSATAALLSGTRSALLAILAGAIALAVISRIGIRAKHLVLTGALVAVLGGFYFSPAGTRLRARAAWSGEDPTGGARPLLWRDSLRMIAARPFIGYGPETFQAAFGVWQSPELARLYPDFHHESPHNVALDTLTAQGIPGLLLVLAWATLAIRSLTGAIQSRVPLAEPLAAAFAGSTTASLFNALSLSPVLLTFLILAMILALEPPRSKRKAWAQRTTVRILGYVAAISLAWLMVSIAITDFRFAKFQRNPSLTVYESAVKARLPGPGEDTYCSRILLNACESAQGIPARLECWRQAEQVAARAISSADDTANAWYNLAYFTASQNDARGTAKALGRAIQLYPNWFKPHWALAKLLSQTGDTARAAAEAERAAFLNANHDPEVLQTAKELRTKIR